MHIFVAVPLPEKITEELERWTHIHREQLTFRRRTHPHDYHITLQFLGEATPSKVEDVQAALGAIRCTPFALALHGFGTFGTPQAPRVLWAAVAGELQGLHALHTSVVQANAVLGFAPEERPYAPHITLARRFEGASPFTLDTMTTALAAEAWEADRFVLMQTHKHASPMYEVIGEYELTKPQN
ncbi:RNA 2',3'-cyclic phosphodiesterase [Paenibacillus filicis]|uniref:RNA 2',3'-cyclic phosphodiesterase n=1 Tax=Paenibacillus filicis TaxID=669464 RepID=A0ABU9DUT3_9BACL